MLSDGFILIGLFTILLLTMTMPFLSKSVERHLEAFLLFSGVCSALLSDTLNESLVRKAIQEPLLLTVTVIAAGLFMCFFSKGVINLVMFLQCKLSSRLLVFLVVVFLGLSASIVTAIIASLVFVEFLKMLDLTRRKLVNLSVIGCYSIGMGASLTPIGEPLAAIAASKLEVSFFFLFQTLGYYVIPAVLFFGVIAAFVVPCSPIVKNKEIHSKNRSIAIIAVMSKAFRVYLFMTALIFLGTGLEPMIERFLLPLDYRLLYWFNMISAVLDNATLTAAEINKNMSCEQIRAIILGLLVSGGMLIPGNIPNIIIANNLGIRSKEWANMGVPFGLVFAAFYFVLLCS